MAIGAGQGPTSAEAPEGWHRLSVGDVARFQSGAGISVSRLEPESTDSPIPVFGGNGVAGFTRHALTQEATVAIGRVGQQCGQVHLTSGPSWITDNALYPRVIRRPVHLPFFALALKALSLNGLKNKNDLPLLTQTILHGAEIALPTSVDEQQAIAEALSDADALIESLSLLLAKKRQIKQGAMQELLTGKRRLPGFRAPWKRSQLGRLLSVRHGRNQRLVECDGGQYPILATGGRIGWASQFLHDKPSVLIGRKGTIDEPQFMDTPFWTVDTLFYTEIHCPNVAKFLFYRFFLVDWMRYNEASGVPSLNARVIESIEIEHPDPDEQGAIADALSSMDAEIDGAEALLEKVRHVKQGMMQALLTGRIRLMQHASNAIPLPA